MSTNTPTTDVALRTSGTTMQVGAGQMQEHELASIERQANMLAQSSIVPRAFKGKPADIVAVASIGREVGLSPMASMQSIHIIEGKPTMSAQLMGSLVRGRGHSLRIDRLDDDGCRMVGVRADTGDSMEYEFTRQHAQAAGLLGKQVWKAHFRAMALARCTSQIARNLFGDVLAGISYTPEEGADIAGVDVRVDAEGEVVEIQGEVVPTRAEPTPTTAAAMPAEDAPAGKERHAEIVALVQQLADAERPDFTAWSHAEGIKWGVDSMTVAMADAIAAKVESITAASVEEEAVTGAVEEPADADDQVPAPVEPVDDEQPKVAANGATIPPNPARARRASTSAA